MTYTKLRHALLLQVSRHIIVWRPGTWGATGWGRQDGKPVGREESLELTALNLGRAITVDSPNQALRYFSARAARLSTLGEQALRAWEKQAVDAA